MPPRVLDWYGLCRVADRRNPPDRIISLAGLPARVVPSRGTDCGFYVRTESDRSGELDGYWRLFTRPELLLLQDLVAAGQVTIDDDEDPYGDGAWERQLADDTRGCFIAGCHLPVDPASPVFDDRGGMHKVCEPHRAAITTVLGETGVADEPEGPTS